MDPRELQDPFKLKAVLWPDVYFYRKQRLVIESVWRDDETYVAAGNMLGKDYVAGFIALAFFLTRFPCRIVTTSANGAHLKVLWGEINQFLQTSRVPLDYTKGGPLLVNHQHIRRMHHGQMSPKCYLTSMVAGPDTVAAMGGHHVANTGDGVPRTLFMVDEASSLDDRYLRIARGWFNRALVFGNCWDCENEFKYAFKGNPKTNQPGGNVPRDAGGFHRYCIRIKAQDSPNVELAERQLRAGIRPTGEVLVPGVKSYQEYVKNRKTWDAIQQCVGLDAEWWEGAELRLFPAEYLRAATKRWRPGRQSKRLYLGCDPGEGGANSSWVIGDAEGVTKVLSMKTPDTSVVPQITLDLMGQHSIAPNDTMFDRGGGGKQHADRINEVLERKGEYRKVRTVAFGEAVAMVPRRGLVMVEERIEHKEERYAFLNRRAQLFGEASLLFDPAYGVGYALPPEELGPEYGRLHHQLRLLPKQYDGEGRLYLPPKNRRPGEKETKVKTLVELMGCSPDEMDAFGAMTHCMMHEARQAVAGTFR